MQQVQRDVAERGWTEEQVWNLARHPWPGIVSSEVENGRESARIGRTDVAKTPCVQSS